MAQYQLSEQDLYDTTRLAENGNVDAMRKLADHYQVLGQRASVFGWRHEAAIVGGPDDMREYANILFMSVETEERRHGCDWIFKAAKKEDRAGQYLKIISVEQLQPFHQNCLRQHNALPGTDSKLPFENKRKTLEKVPQVEKPGKKFLPRNALLK